MEHLELVSDNTVAGLNALTAQLTAMLQEAEALRARVIKAGASNLWPSVPAQTDRFRKSVPPRDTSAQFQRASSSHESRAGHPRPGFRRAPANSQGSGEAI